MNTRIPVALLTVLVATGGCVIYLDHPPKRTITGQVVRADTGEPLTNASVALLSGRKPFSLLPVDTFGIDAHGSTDRGGHFSITARLNDSVRALVQNGVFAQMFTLPPFFSNRIDNVVLKITDRIPNQAVQRTGASRSAQETNRTSSAPSFRR